LHTPSDTRSTDCSTHRFRRPIPRTFLVSTSFQYFGLTGYNSVTEPRILARFGKDAVAECAAETQAAYDYEHGEE
jgi:hypothetical protein